MRHALGAIAALALVALSGCVLPRPDLGRGPALHLSELVAQGDATRRASLRLVLDALEADRQRDVRRAQGLYARALQIDSGNPYVYLALARHHADAGEASVVFEHLARARELLAAEAPDSPRVDVHLIGLRGIALRLDGRVEEGDRLLRRAAEVAPVEWGDAQLSAEELR